MRTAVAGGRGAATRRRGWLHRAALALALPLVAAASGGCTRAVGAVARPYLVAASGLERAEQAMRDALLSQRWDAALAQVADLRAGGPSDALLRELYRGTTAFYAGRWRASAEALDRAAAMADDRFTRSASRGALAIATSDRALPYLPGQNERLFVHYYAMLAYLHARDVDGAAVEARRLAFLLQRYDDGRDPLDASTRAVLRYLTGVAFDAAGEREDAAVAYRNARALLAGAPASAGAEGDASRAASADPDPWLGGRLAPTGPWPGPAALADSATRRLVAATRGRARRRAPRPVADATRVAAAPRLGEVVVVIERGFVAHRVDERLHVRLRPGTLAAWASGGGGRYGDDGAGARLAALLAGDAALFADAMPAALALDDVATPADSGCARAGSGCPARPVAGDGLPAGSDRGPAPRVGEPRVAATTVAAPSPGPRAGVPAGVWTLEARGPAPRGAPGDGGAAEVVGAILAGDQQDDRRDGRGPHRGEGTSRLLTLAWPAYRRPAPSPPARAVLAPDAARMEPAALFAAPAAPLLALAAGDGVPHTGGVLGAPVALRGDVSLAVAGDFKRDRPRLLARLVARAALRQTLAAQAGRTHRALGDLVATLGSAVEHADTRSWHLLPGVVEVVRLRLPAGRRELRVDVGGGQTRLGIVDVRAGGVTVFATRLWDDADAPRTASMAPLSPPLP